MECALCTEVYTYFGLPKCGHKSICSLCWYRLRSILDSKSCPLCRQTSDFLFITSSNTLIYDSLINTNWNDSFKGFTLDLQSQIYFEDSSELQRLINFKQLVCKICSAESKNFKSYKDHLMRFHNKKLCEVCSRNNNLFPSEQELYEDSQLGVHKINHHVQCDLCFDYYYDQRKLLEHIKSKHFFCELCDVVKRTAFSSYEDLEGHYRQAHFLCEVGVCREEMHVVFMCYDDLRDHYRSNHPGIAIPAPVCAFRFRDDEEKPIMVFDDVSSKNYVVPKINEENKDFEFPALGSASEKKNVIDYSRISQKSKGRADGVFDPSFFPPTSEVLGSSKGKKGNAGKKKDLPLFEKNIARLNNGHMSLEEFLEQVPEADRENVSRTVITVRKLVTSNTNKEKIVQELEKMQKIRDRKVTEEVKSRPQQEEKKTDTKKTVQWVNESFPALGNAKAPKIKTEFNTLLENIVIYNNSLITAKYFVDNLLEFMPRSEVSLYRKTIKDQVRPEARANEALNLLDHILLMTANESEYPSLVPAKPVYEKTPLDLLKSNLKILNQGMMTSKEFITNCCQDLEKTLIPEAVRLIKASIMNSAQANKICKEILSSFQMGDYQEEFPTLRMVSIPAEPKRKKK